MSDEFIEALKKNEETLSKLSDEKIMYLALSELMVEMALGKDTPAGLKIKRIALSAELAITVLGEVSFINVPRGIAVASAHILLTIIFGNSIFTNSLAMH